jgi:KTSC domain
LDVPPSLHRELLAADSKGHFIAENLRGKYKFVRVRPRRNEARSRERIASQER